MTFLHFYPDLMNLYGSYANLLVLKRTLEAMGETVEIVPVRPGEAADIAHADFLFMGAGTERAQKAALQDFARFAPAVKAAAEADVPMLFAGTAMELLGKTITDADGNQYDGIGLGDFTAVQSKKRIVEDVLGTTDLFETPVVGFINKCAAISGVETPLLTALTLGYGNEKPLGPEGFRFHHVIGSELTGPILVKNPRLLDGMADAVLTHAGKPIPKDRPRDHWAEDGCAVTIRELQKRVGK